MPVVIVYAKTVDIVGGIQNLVDTVVDGLPEGGWVLLILGDESLRFNQQPSQLSEANEPAAQAAGQACRALASALIQIQLILVRRNELSTSELVYDRLGEEGADYIKGGGTWTHVMFAFFAFLSAALIAVTLAAALLWKR